MINKSLIKGMFLIASLVSSGAYAATQSIVASPASFSNIAVGDTVQFDVNYPATNPSDATGLGLKIYYDSSKLTPAPGTRPGITNLNIPKIQGVQDLPDAANGDGDATTDRFFNIAWAATSEFDPFWNPSGEVLVTVTFTAAAGFTSDTAVNFTGDPSAGNTFSANPVPVKLKVGTPPPSDNTPPVVTAPADVSKEATGPTTPVSLGAGTATDDVDGTKTPTASPTGPFAVGVHTVTWSAKDAAGNIGTDTQQVTVTDTTPPVVTPPANKTVTATGTNTPVTLGTATATDLVDGAVTPVTPSTTGPFPVGVSNINWSATDAHGNTGTATQTVTITEAPVEVDTIPPVITVPPDVTVQLQSGETQATVDFGTATAVDNVDGVVSVTWTQSADVAAFTAGTHTIIWRAADAAGNVATAPQRIIVLAAPLNPPAQGIPTLSEWGIIMLSLMLALVSWVGVGRKKI